MLFNLIPDKLLLLRYKLLKPLEVPNLEEINPCPVTSKEENLPQSYKPLFTVSSGQVKTLLDPERSSFPFPVSKNILSEPE